MSITWIENTVKEKRGTGTFVGVRIPTHMMPFINAFSKSTHHSLPKSIVYIIQLYMELVFLDDQGTYTLTKILKENAEAIKQAEKIREKYSGGLTIDDGVRKKIFDIIKDHPCKNLISYEEENNNGTNQNKL